MRADQAWLVEEVGPRPAGSDAERSAAEGVAARLRAAGWSPRGAERPTNLVACRGAPARVFLAHIDSVPGSPGAVDNAAAVAILLELARDPELRDLCVAFPDAEEIGLQGSAAMARSGPWAPGMPRLAVALDLVGHGDLRVMGLGRHWSDSELRWLHDRVGAAARVPIVHRLYSRALPPMERSDHAPFADRGAPALLLFGAGPGEVFDRYHQPEDDLRRGRPGDDAALLDALRFVRALAEGPPMPPPAGRGDGMHVGPLLLPWWWWAAALAGATAGLVADLRRRPPLLRLLALPLLGAGLGTAGYGLSYGAFVMLLPWAGRQGLQPPPVAAERTAAAVMGLSRSGWWEGAPLAAGAALLLLIVARRLSRRLWPDPRLSSWAAGLSAWLALLLDPLLCGIFAAASLLARVHPALAAAPAALLLRPDALRQLAFHGLIDPAAWGGLAALLALGLAAAPTRSTSPQGPRSAHPAPPRG